MYRQLKKFIFVYDVNEVKIKLSVMFYFSYSNYIYNSEQRKNILKKTTQNLKYLYFKFLKNHFARIK